MNLETRNIVLGALGGLAAGVIATSVYWIYFGNKSESEKEY